ncbi:hypothetical protein PG996_007813 [Apiospora saccharicola]|uniref:Uncharacterized protein n=1 Tax=Apiospora saccharicola TaxID=335842 RepID=A0ABR1UW48_9PEZI
MPNTTSSARSLLPNKVPYRLPHPGYRLHGALPPPGHLVHPRRSPTAGHARAAERQLPLPLGSGQRLRADANGRAGVVLENLPNAVAVDLYSLETCTEICLVDPPRLDESEFWQRATPRYDTAIVEIRNVSLAALSALTVLDPEYNKGHNLDRLSISACPGGVRWLRLGGVIDELVVENCTELEYLSPNAVANLTLVVPCALVTCLGLSV